MLSFHQFQEAANPKSAHVFHGGAYSTWESIKSSGLLWKPPNTLYHSTEILGGVYLSETPEYAFQFALNSAYQNASKPIMLVIEIGDFDQLAVEPDHDNITDFLHNLLGQVFPDIYAVWERYHNDESFQPFVDMVKSRLPSINDPLLQELRDNWDDVAVVLWKFMLDSFLTPGQSDDAWAGNYYVALKNLTEKSKYMALKGVYGDSRTSFTVYQDIGFTGVNRIIGAVLYDGYYPSQILYGTPETCKEVTSEDAINKFRTIVPQQIRASYFDMNTRNKQTISVSNGLGVAESAMPYLTEISKQKLASYIKKASNRAGEHDYMAGMLGGNGRSNLEKQHTEKANKRRVGISKAADKMMMGEDVRLPAQGSAYVKPKRAYKKKIHKGQENATFVASFPASAKINEVSANTLRKYISIARSESNHTQGGKDFQKKKIWLHKAANRYQQNTQEQIDGSLPINTQKNTLKGQNTKAGAGLTGTWQVLQKYISMTPGQTEDIPNMTVPDDKPFKRNILGESVELDEQIYIIRLDRIDNRNALLFAHNIEKRKGLVTGLTSAKIVVKANKDMEDDFATIADELGVGIKIKRIDESVQNDEEKTKTYSVNYDDHGYFVTVDRKRLGDDRMFDTYEKAKDEADSRAKAQGYLKNGQKAAISIPGYRRPKG